MKTDRKVSKRAKGKEEEAQETRSEMYQAASLNLIQYTKLDKKKISAFISKTKKQGKRSSSS